MSNEKHTPMPLTIRLHKNGRDYEIVAQCLRPEWIGRDLPPTVVAVVSSGDFTDATGAAHELNRANAEFFATACNSHDALVAFVMRVAFEPIGNADASAREIIDTLTGEARLLTAAIKAAKGEA